ncbi:SecDF P1 head subdomain-containing protein [Streptomyces sp. NPDC005141]
MRLPRAPHTALLICVAAATLAACSGSGSEDHPSGSAGSARTGGAAPSAAADGRRSVVTFAGSSPLGSEALRHNVDRMRARAEALKLTDVRVEAREGTITVTGPTADEKRLTELGASGRLGFRPVLAAEAALSPSLTPQPSPSPDPARGRAVTEGLRPRATGSASASAAPAPDEGSADDAALQARFAALDCSKGQKPTAETDDSARESVVACGDGGGAGSAPAKYVLGPTAVDGAHVASAEAAYDKGIGIWTVRLDFDSVGTRQFAAVTADLSAQQAPQNQFAIVLDGAVISAPSVNQSLTGGQAEISGGFTRKSAEQLAVTLDSGALPNPLTVTGVTRLPHP